MLHGEVFQKLEEMARVLRDNPKPFGGIQLVVTGDFFQLPPVSKGGPRFYCFQTVSITISFHFHFDSNRYSYVIERMAIMYTGPI
jgi:hypothetical protein